MAKIAIVLFNLGGPDKPEAVRPFLFALFSDPAIIAAPRPLRWLIAQLISRRRTPVATAIYAKIGGGSPIVPNTQAQARALDTALSDLGEVRSWSVMRYWHPRAAQVAAEIKAWDAERVVLLPLYPQFSTTTTASSLADWSRAAQAVGLATPATTTCCYPAEPGFIAALTDLIGAELRKSNTPMRLLFTAHGLPQRVVDAGDPYQWQIERTAAAVVERLAMPDLDWVVSYQSRVGPLKWLGPYTEEEITRAGRDKRAILLAPIAFVSEHSETLVELDITYRELAAEHGVPGFARVPTVSTHADFIAGLARLVRQTLLRPSPVASGEGAKLCPYSFAGCAMKS
jgi:protoporphyrin/coproporphyrin ferrochelatase